MKPTFTHSRKHRRSLMAKLLVLALMMLLAPIGAKAADILVAKFNDDKTTFTFTYADESTVDRQTVFAVPKNNNEGIGWYNKAGTVTKVVFDPSVATARPTTTRRWLWGMPNLTEIEGIKYLNTSEVTSMDEMFFGCKKLESIDLSGFNTDKVTSMESMFYLCQGLTSLDVSKFNTENVTTMEAMFERCEALTSIDVSNFNTAKVTNMRAMFANCSQLKALDISNFTISATTNVKRFAYCSVRLENLTLGSNDFKNISDDNKAEAFLNIGRMVNATLTVDEAFDQSVLGEASSGKYTWLNGTFALKVIAPIVQVSGSGSRLTLTFTMGDKAAVDGETVFAVTNNGNSNPTWNNYDRQGKIIKVVFDASFAKARPLSTSNWFNRMSNLLTIIGLQYLNTSETTTMNNMFAVCSSLSTINVSGFDTRKVTNMYGMFNNCSSLRSIDVSKFNTENVTDMSFMFGGCTSLEKISVSSFNTKNVKYMSNMFSYCSALTTLDVSTFNVSSLTGMPQFAQNSTGITKLIVGNLDFSSLGSSAKENAFTGIGTSASPAELVTYEKFNKNVLGNKVSNGAYTWLGGTFKLTTTSGVPAAVKSGGGTSRTLTFTIVPEEQIDNSTVYSLPAEGETYPKWTSSYSEIATVVFSPMFASASPVNTGHWFSDMKNLKQ